MSSGPSFFEGIVRLATTTVLFLLCAGAVQSQHIDFENAPLNPVPFRYRLSHFNLKGSVYAHGNKVFSREGNLVYENSLGRGLHYLYQDGKLRTDTDGNLYEFDSQGFLTKKIFASSGIQSVVFAYNTKGLLVSEKSTTGYTAYYTYDEKNRLIKSSIGGGVREYAYQQNGEQLTVTIKDHTKTPIAVSTQVYKKGVEIRRDGRLFSIQYDSKGNRIEYNKNIYYDDLANRRIELSMVYKKPTMASIDPMFECTFYVNGVESRFLYAKLLDSNRMLVYNPFDEQYYSIKDAINQSKSGQKQVFEKVAAAGPFHIRKAANKYTFCYKGADLSNSIYLRKNALVISNIPFFFVYDKSLNMTFVGGTDDIRPAGLHPVQHFSPGNNLLYFKYEDRHIIIYEGQNMAKIHPEYKLVDHKSGNAFLVNEKNVPIYCFPDAAKEIPLKAYAGRTYNPETDSYELTTSSAQPPNQSAGPVTNSLTNTNTCISGDCQNGFGSRKGSMSTYEGFFKSGHPTGFGYQDLGSLGYYYGNFKMGEFDGFGMFTWRETGNYYIGQWKNNKMHGYGYIKKGGTILNAGYFNNGILEQKMLSASFLNKQWNGNCIGDCENGFGYYKYSDGSIYVGFFTGKKPNYVGAYTFRDGSSYIGEWVYGKRNFQGFESYADGTSYRGEFMEGKRNGEGVLYNKSGKVISKGNWIKGKLAEANKVVTGSVPAKLDSYEPDETIPMEVASSMKAYKSGTQQLKQYVENLDEKWTRKFSNEEEVAVNYAALLQAIYKIEQPAAFEFMMRLDRTRTSAVLVKLPEDMRTYLRKKAKERIEKYKSSSN